MATPPSIATASKRTALPGQVCEPRLTTRTRQSVTVSLEVEWSFSMERARSCHGRSGVSGERAASAREKRKTEAIGVPPSWEGREERGRGTREDGRLYHPSGWGIWIIP